MRNLIVLAITLFYLPNALSESWFFSNNTVSSGKININGQELGTSDLSIKGSGIKQTVNREVSNFDSVNSRGAFDIKYSQGPLSLTISGDDNIIDFVLTDVVKSTLQISIDKSYRSKYPIIIKLSSPKIESLAIHGTSDVKLIAIKSKKLKLDLSGAVSLFADGTVTDLQLKVHGTGDVKLKPLVAGSVTVDIQGTGDIELTAKEQLEAKIFGVGDILYFGNPTKVSKHVFGVGNIVAAE